VASPQNLDADLVRFVQRLRARLVAGATVYGNESFTRPAIELVDEIQQEIEDVAGWGLILWIRLERLRERVAGVVAAAEQVPPSPGRS
jgi:hypothetical protein